MSEAINADENKYSITERDVYFAKIFLNLLKKNKPGVLGRIQAAATNNGLGEIGKTRAEIEQVLDYVLNSEGCISEATAFQKKEAGETTSKEIQRGGYKST